MELACYIEINVICIILTFFVTYKNRKNKTANPVSKMSMSALLIFLFVLCVSDIAAILIRGKTFIGSRALVYISNILYMDMGPLIAMCWLDYVCSRTGILFKKSKMIMLHLPAAIFVVFSILNPWTHLLFSVDEKNIYSRGPLVFVHWIFSFFYLTIAAVISWRAAHKTASFAKRAEYRLLLTFFILPIIGSVLQMLFYGITALQVGTILSILLLTMNNQENQITLDELTGINNRKAMQYFIENFLRREALPKLSVSMIDINHFKQINDSFGHVVGDEVLCFTSNVLKRLCEKSKYHLFLCRFGGDEFVIIGIDVDENSLEEFNEGFVNEFNEISLKESPRPITISMGYGFGACKSQDDFNHLLEAADEMMYEKKKAAHLLSTN